MIDLHLHFDGSLLVESVWEQGKKQNIDLGVKDKDELKEKLSISNECKSLNEYLEKFGLPLSVLQTTEAISECIQDLIQQLISENMLYVEIRFAPQLHCQKDLTQEEVVKAAIDGVKKACLGEKIQVGLILCCMRGNDNQKANFETVDMTKKYLGDIVCACDLAGAEAIFRTCEFKDLFDYAQSLGLPYTIHAGEADGPESIRSAISFGAKRLGHGVYCVEDPLLIEELIEKGITLECCPISNLHTKAVNTMEEHPIVPLLRKGLRTTINTDNRTVSNTTIERELKEVREACQLSKEEEAQLFLNAAHAAFLDNEKKEELITLIKDKYNTK